MGTGGAVQAPLISCSAPGKASAHNDLPRHDKWENRLINHSAAIRYHQEIECVTMILKLELS